MQMVQRDGLREQCHSSNPKAAAGCTSWPGTGCAPAKPEAAKPAQLHSILETRTPQNQNPWRSDGCKQKQPLTHLSVSHTAMYQLNNSHVFFPISKDFIIFGEQLEKQALGPKSEPFEEILDVIQKCGEPWAVQRSAQGQLNGETLTARGTTGIPKDLLILR